MKYSLRSLMIVVMLICVVLGSVSILRFRIANRCRAVEEIKGLGGSVFLDFEWEGAKTPTGFAVEVGKVFGDEFAFSDVTMVAFGGRESAGFGDDQLSLLVQFPRLRLLHLDDTNVTDAGLGRLAELHELKFLDFRGRPLTMNGVEQLRPLLKRIETFRIDGVSDPAVRNRIIEILPIGSELWEGNRNEEPYWKRMRKMGTETSSGLIP